ncbi:MAG: DUF948 domain-containing protein [Bifidobacteriaceae bacterium]|jgi:hypothetical protein|nr:DUF948 domain-containing protein [Bifidobacteriaceae bacterium]
MTLGEVAGLIAALAFVALVGLLAVPVLRLGGVFREATRSVKELTDHTVPILDEAATTVAETNAQLEKVDVITAAAADVSQNVSAMTALFAATLGGPLIKLAAFTYGVRSTMMSRGVGSGGQRGAKGAAKRKAKRAAKRGAERAAKRGGARPPAAPGTPEVG